MFIECKHGGLVNINHIIAIATSIVVNKDLISTSTHKDLTSTSTEVHKVYALKATLAGGGYVHLTTGTEAEVESYLAAFTAMLRTKMGLILYRSLTGVEPPTKAVNEFAAIQER